MSEFKDIIFKLQQFFPDMWLAAKNWKEFVWDVDLDDYVCCDGVDCGCYATTHRQSYEHMRKK